MHKLVYLPSAQEDLRGIVNYIADVLKAPEAAVDLVDVLDHSIRRLQMFPYSCRVFQPIEPLLDEYRVMPVNNYLIFYVVTESEVEIRRIIYAKMDTQTIIK
ncbi:MAG TPA: type II toxin-antitoxin system RelE/ParE family toxin [Clostridia bacterium]